MTEQGLNAIFLPIALVFGTLFAGYVLYTGGPGWRKYRQTKDAQRLIRWSGGELGPRVACLGVGALGLGMMVFVAVLLLRSVGR